MNPNRVLGKGLSALIPDAERPSRLGDKEVKLVLLNQLDLNPDQPRKVFDDKSLNELAGSISQVGILQPVLVRAIGHGDTGPTRSTIMAPERYQVVVGERRVRAARLAGIEEIPAIICSYEETEALKVALLENIQREDLGPIEEATAYRNLLDAYGATQEELAEMLGKNRSSVANALRLLSLESDIQAMLEAGELSRGHAKALLGLPEGEDRMRLAVLCRRRGMSVRECERRVRDLLEPAKPRRKRRKAIVEETREVRALRERTERILGSPVSIDRHPKTGKGTINIRFFSDEDLERLLELMGVDPRLS